MGKLAGKVGDQRHLVVRKALSRNSRLFSNPGISTIRPYNQTRRQSSSILKLQSGTRRPQFQANRPRGNEDLDVVLPP